MVTQTSRQAYATLQHKDEQTVKIARLMLARTDKGLMSWIGQLSRDLCIEKSTVSARLNSLKKSGATVLISGSCYCLKYMGTVKDTHQSSGKTVQAWQLVLFSNKQKTLF